MLCHLPLIPLIARLARLSENVEVIFLTDLITAASAPSCVTGVLSETKMHGAP